MSRRYRRAVIGVVAAAGLAVATAVADRCFPPELSRLADRSVMVVDSDGGLLQAFTARDGRWRLPVTVDQVDPRYVRMLVAYEDKRFESHAGIDPLAALRALQQWIDSGRIVSGASTLTMQTARLLEPRQRSVAAKLVEVARALQLEWRFDKREILDMYLELAPFGGNLEGVRSASLFYYGKEPGHLTDAEAALLVALPQSPELLRPDRHAAAARAGRDRVLRRLATAGVLIGQAAAEAMEQPVPGRRLPARRQAAHLSERLRAQHPSIPVVPTLIDADLQSRIEALARRHQRTLEEGATLAVLVVENAGRAVRAYVGSADFFDDSRFGQNDMVRAVRSPGSALKPFIYGIAFDDLVIHPETIVVDRPMRFGDYAPENFDHHYRGEIPAREALQLSLNLPAVALLDRVGSVRLAQTLAGAGAPLRLPDAVSAPGLPIALGGVGTTLENLAVLYAALADGGVARPLRLTADDPAGEDATLVGPIAAWYLTRILEQAPPPPNSLAPQNRKRGRTVAFKTGTSYGYRDAWAIGYDSAYTVGVWVGRPDGSFSPGRMGRDAAAPVLFAIFDMLPGPGSPANGAAPADAILLSSTELPAHLRRFRGGPLMIGASSPVSPGPEITFPADGAALDLAGEGGTPAALVLRARGGQMPLLWLVNGAPVPSASYRRQAQWQPDGAGATRITVIDRTGAAASVEVWLQ